MLRMFLAILLIALINVNIAIAQQQSEDNQMSLWAKQCFAEVQRLSDEIDSKSTSAQQSEATSNAAQSLPKFMQPKQLTLELKVQDVVQERGVYYIVAKTPDWLSKPYADVIRVSKKHRRPEQLRLKTTSETAKLLEKNDIVRVLGTVHLRTLPASFPRPRTPEGFPFCAFSVFQNWYEIWFTPASTTKIETPQNLSIGQ